MDMPSNQFIPKEFHDPVIAARAHGPAAVVAALAGAADRLETPCGDGAMVWHRWQGPDAVKDQPPLVLLHGGFGSWTHWIRVIPALAARYTVYAADMPGKGDSADAPKPHTADGLAAIIADGLDRLLPGATACYDLAGFSFGGTLGSRVARMQGARCRTFVAVGASGFGPLHFLVDGIVLPGPDMPAAEVAAIHANNLALLMCADPANIDPLAIHTHSLNTARSRVRSRAISKTEALMDALPDINARIAGIWGVHDATGGGRADIERRRDIMRSHQPDAPFHIIENAGHWVMYEAPDAFVAALRDILDG